MEQLRIAATSHGINYLPQYYATASGAFARRGLELAPTAHDPWTGTLEALAAGDADIVLGGVWVPAMYAGSSRDYAVFGQLNARFPMTLVTRDPVEEWNWGWLAGRTVLAPGAGGTAMYEFTAGVLREHGVDPGAIKFVRDLSTDMLRELYEAGLGDAFIADALTAAELELGGLGHPAVLLAEVGGPMANSVYYTDRARLPELHDRLVALMDGIREAMDALRGGADSAAVIAAEWPAGPHAALQQAATALAANGTWSGVRLDPSALDRWVGILRDRGLLLSDADTSYSALIDTSVLDALEPVGAVAGGPGNDVGGARG
jgi:NitT/TauT family transport system substrate-binding protein